MTQNDALPYPDADLRKHPPRRADVMIGGLYFLARTIDKMRAKIQGTLGEYKVLPGISGYMFTELGITEQQFEDAVRSAKTDDDVVAWLQSTSDPAKYPALNEMLRNRRIRDDAHRAEFAPRYPVLDEHPELWNWFEIFVADDAWLFDEANRGKPGSALS